MAIENTHASINVELSKTQSCNIMKHIEVVAAIIRDEEGCVFATQRGLGEWKDWWEFPGGKMEVGETPEVFSISPKVFFVSPKVILNIPRVMQKVFLLFCDIPINLYL